MQIDAEARDALKSQLMAVMSLAGEALLEMNQNSTIDNLTVGVAKTAANYCKAFEESGFSRAEAITLTASAIKGSTAFSK